MSRKNIEQINTEKTIWDLSYLYKNKESFEQDKATLLLLSEDFQKYDTRSPSTKEEVHTMLQDYEILTEVSTRLISYGFLYRATRLFDSEANEQFQNVMEFITKVQAKCLFFEKYVVKWPSHYATEIQRAYPYFAPFIKKIRKSTRHILSLSLEKLFTEISPLSENWMRLFEQTMGQITFTIGKKTYTESELLTLFMSPDQSLRHQAAKALGRGLKDNIMTFALIYNTRMAHWNLERTWRKYTRIDGPRNFSNELSDSVVDTMVSAISNLYPQTSHRYYQLKAKLLGSQKLHYADRMAPLFTGTLRQYTFSEAKDIVLQAYSAFSPEMAKIAEPFFSRGQLDVYPHKGKLSGAFSHPTVPKVHPYILLNYQSTHRDVMTLAHELGHGIHQTLAAPQGILLQNPPLTLAETASVFGEMLTFQYVYGKAITRDEKIYLLSQKIEDTLATIVRQIAFYQWERAVHSERQKGEVPVERLNELWFTIQKMSLGPAVQYDSYFPIQWAYIPHFIHTPFYVYAYAFGNCLVNALYEHYLDNRDTFPKKYIHFLSLGGRATYDDLKEFFGLDIRKKLFYIAGIQPLIHLINMLEEIINGQK